MYCVQYMYSCLYMCVRLYDNVILSAGHLREEVVELRQHITRNHQQLFSPPLPEIQVTTPDQISDRHDLTDGTGVLQGT